MDKSQLYDKITERKIKPKDFEPYDGNNGRVNRCVDLFNKGTLRSGGVLLDVGGGIGDLGYSLRDRFDETIVVDISKENLRAAEEKGNTTYLADTDRDGLEFLLSDSVDIVCALDFIEHIIDPEYFARECFRVLKSSGQVFINTPNIEFWRHLESQVVHGIFPHTSGDREVYHGGHLAFYNFNDMKKIFGFAGFRSFEQVKDEEGYSQPGEIWMKLRESQCLTQKDYIEQCLRLGCSNLLFKCEKP